MWLFLALTNVILAYFADVYYNKGKRLSIFFLLMIVIEDTFFIGLRDFGVGIDTLTYIHEYFKYASDLSIGDIILDDSVFDKGFLLLACAANILSDNPQALLVVTEFFIISFIVWGCYEYKKTINYSIPWFFALFWLLYQHETINLMRQFCAMSLLFLGFANLMNKKYIVYIFLQVIAFFFHSTSVLFLIVPVAFFISKTKSNLKYLILIVPILAGYYVLNNYYDLLEYFVNTGLVSEIYGDRYGLNSKYVEGNMGGFRYALKYLIPFVLFIIAFLRNLLSKNYLYMLVLLFVLTMMLEQARFILEYFFRMAIYVGLIYIVYMSSLFKIKYWNKSLMIQPLYILLLIYNAYLTYNYMDSFDAGNIYKSHILGIN